MCFTALSTAIIKTQNEGVHFGRMMFTPAETCYFSLPKKHLNLFGGLWWALQVGFSRNLTPICATAIL